MAGTKFSAFTTGATTADTFIVGYDSGAGTNNQYTLAQLAAGLPVNTLYGADGTIGTTRKALITDTIQFRNAGDTSDIFKLNTDGTFILGLGATNTAGDNSVIIGKSATDTAATNTYNTIIGASASVTGASNAANVVVGDSSLSTASGGVAIGSEAQANAVGVIAIGQRTKPTGANSITLDATGASVTAPSTANAFGVYMSSNTTADFEVVGGGESTLNTSLKITGQGYTELHTVTSAASITPDWNNSNVQTFELTSASTTIVNPSNIKPGATYILILKQDSTGGRTVSFGTQYNFPADTAPTLTTTANKADVITLVAYSSTVLMCTSVLDFTTT
tara:strand:+ start:5905 stop:6909 length:1005 start_codon:yes stop_codon:yes gene_type:complete